MEYLEKIITPPLACTVILIVIIGTFWLLEANNPSIAVAHSSHIKSKIKQHIQNEPQTHLQNLFKSPQPPLPQLIQAAAVVAVGSEQSTEPLSIKIKNITTDDNTISIAFEIRNHNQNTVLLEGLNYKLFYNNHRLVTGSIGSQLISDIFQSQSEFPVIGNGYLVLKDTQKFEKGGEFEDKSSKSIPNGNSQYTANGTAYYRQISNIQAYDGTQQFESAFP
jgi:hypothetical protein